MATVVTGQNVISNAIGKSQYRMVGEVEGDVSRWDVIVSNFSVPMLNLALLIAALALIVVAVIIGKGKTVLSLSPLALIWVLPYVWYEVLFNHSVVHTFFTYRSQLGSLFCLMAVIVICISLITGKYKKGGATENKA